MEAPTVTMSAEEYGAIDGWAALETEGMPALSPNALALLQAAQDEAMRRGHPSVGTEHVLWALIQPSCDARVKGWLRDRIQPQTGGEDWQAHLLARLDANPLWASSGAVGLAPPPLTVAMTEIFGVVREFATGPVSDGGVRIVDGLVASEFLIAAVLLHGINVCSELLGRASIGSVNSWTIFEAINIDPRTVHVNRSVTTTIEMFSECGGASMGPPYELGTSLPDPQALPAPPTHTSNWLVPGHVLIGERPGGTWPQGPGGPDALALADAGVTTFVSLVGEYSSQRYRQREYPSDLLREGRAADFLHFPIDDFELPDQSALEALVLELKRRVVAGEVIYVHCRGGHGRTGTVVIPLLSGLYNLDNEPARQYVCAATLANRPSENPAWGIHMPETPEQCEMAAAVNPTARALVRGVSGGATAQ